MGVDLWSAGVILYVLLSGMPPFWGNSDQEIFASIQNTALDFTTAPWPHVSRAAKDLVSRCFPLTTGLGCVDVRTVVWRYVSRIVFL